MQIAIIRKPVAFAATTLALAAGLAVAAPAHADVPGTQSAATATSTLAPAPHTSATSTKKIHIKGTRVALRECPRTSCRVDTRVSNATVRAYCQTNRHTSTVSGNKWWTKVTLLSGSDPAWVSNHYVRTAAPKVPHLRNC